MNSENILKSYNKPQSLVRKPVANRVDINEIQNAKSAIKANMQNNVSTSSNVTNEHNKFEPLKKNTFKRVQSALERSEKIDSRISVDSTNSNNNTTTINNNNANLYSIPSNSSATSASNVTIRPHSIINTNSTANSSIASSSSNSNLNLNANTNTNTNTNSNSNSNSNSNANANINTNGNLHSKQNAMSRLFSKQTKQKFQALAISSVQISQRNRKDKSIQKKDDLKSISNSYGIRKSLDEKTKSAARKIIPINSSTNTTTTTTPYLTKRRSLDLPFLQNSLTDSYKDIESPEFTAYSPKPPFQSFNSASKSTTDLLSAALQKSSNEKEYDIKHKHHFLRSRKEPQVLSSSSSNSRVISNNGSLYSFNPASPSFGHGSLALQRSFSALDLKSLTGREQQTSSEIIEDYWDTFSIKTRSLFIEPNGGSQLRTPVEDLNLILCNHMKKLISENNFSSVLLDELKDLFISGMISGPVSNSNQKLDLMNDVHLIIRLVEIWNFFYEKVLPYWEAICLPLQQEFDKSLDFYSNNSSNFFLLTESSRSSLAWNFSEELGVRELTLVWYRDIVLIPLIERLRSIFTRFFKLRKENVFSKIHDKQQMNQTNDKLLELPDYYYNRLLHCVFTISSLMSQDENQKLITSLVRS